ncbi:spermidine synthase [Nocardiopsis sp. NPDC050513]|uniref:spermidine synthase n=1 Tax=Nocardiopsis sp. NPDC050513 TaxID=3364338 RepID=UPI0037B0719D
MAKPRIEELGWCPTPIGEISLRRRWDPVARTDVHEIRLDDAFLMSSLFTAAEEEMARLALAELRAGGRTEGFDVVVGGLGLGYTAAAVLDDPGVRSLAVVEVLDAVVDWHERGLVPDAGALSTDPRCRLVRADFFAEVASPGGLLPDEPDRVFDALVVDIDHSPRHVLDPSHAELYTQAGTRRLTDHLRPGGVFALWSDDPPDDAYLEVLGTALDRVRAEVVAFANPYRDEPSANTVYLGTRPVAPTPPRAADPGR